MTSVGDDDYERLHSQIKEQATPRWTGHELTDHEVGYVDGLRKALNYLEVWWKGLRDDSS